MSKEIKTTILLKTSPKVVWEVLTDFENYPSWNPFVKYIKGEVKIGNRIKVKIEPPQSKAMIFTPKILAYENEKELRWLGHFLFSGLFDGEHKFELVDNKNGTTTFIQSEKFKGILVPLFKKQLDNNTKKGFNEMNEELKKIVEQK